MIDLLPDLCDEFPTKVRVCQSQFQHFGKHMLFHGEVITVKCFEDNSFVKSLLNKEGKGKVLVVDGGGSFRRALLGDQIAAAAVKNGWAGVIINGCIRDAAQINQMDLGVKCLGTTPIKTDKKDVGEINVSINCCGAQVDTGQYAFADLNGVLFADTNLLESLHN